MRLTLIGILTGLVLCEAVHGFDAADLNSVSSAIQGSTQDVLLGAGRSMRGLKALHKGIPAQTARNLLQTAVPPDSQEVTAEVTDGQAQATSLCDMARCKISYAETANVLEESRGAGGGDKDKFTDYADRLTICAGRTEGGVDSCDVGACVWDDDSSTCFPVLDEGDDAFVKCGVDISVLQNMGRIAAQCYDASQGQCNSQATCTWDPTARRKCKIDPWEVLGYSDTAAGGLPTGFAEMKEDLLVELEDHTKKEFLFFYNTAAGKVQALEIVSSICDDVDEDQKVLCNFLKNILHSTFKIDLYCSKKYKNRVAGCDRDPQCEGVSNSQCGIAAEEESKIIKDEFLDVNRGELKPSEPTMELLFDCSEKAEDNCIDGCAWKENTCNPNQLGIFQILKSLADESAETDCGMLSSLYATEKCSQHRGRSKCNRIEGCSYEGGFCRTNSKDTWKIRLQADDSFAFIQKEWNNCVNQDCSLE